MAAPDAVGRGDELTKLAAFFSNKRDVEKFRRNAPQGDDVTLLIAKVRG